MDKKEQKLKIDDVKAPPKDHLQYNYVGGLLEAVKGDFRAFGEVLSSVKETADATFEELGRFKIEMAEFKTETTDHFKKIDGKLDKMDQHFIKIDGRLDNIEKELKSIKSEFEMFKKSFDKTKAEELEKRIFRIEQKLGLAVA